MLSFKYKLMDVEQLQYFSAGFFSGPFSMALFKHTESNIPLKVLQADVLFCRQENGSRGCKGILGAWSFGSCHSLSLKLT